MQLSVNLVGRQLALIAITVVTIAVQSAFALPAQHSSPVLEDLHAAEAESAANIKMAGSSASPQSIMNPDASEWKCISASTVPLFAQTIVAPHGGGSVVKISVKALRLRQGVAFHLEWKDATSRSSVGQHMTYSDAAAIEFPIDLSGDTRLSMGNSGGSVNILYWRADIRNAKGALENKAQELMAAGSANLAPKPLKEQLLRSRSQWNHGRWQVVIFKPLSTAEKSNSVLGAGVDVPIAFAVWNGSAGERLGMKSISNWHVLSGQ